MTTTSPDLTITLDPPEDLFLTGTDADGAGWLDAQVDCAIPPGMEVAQWQAFLLDESVATYGRSRVLVHLWFRPIPMPLVWEGDQA